MKPPRIVYLYLVLATAMWGSSYVVSKSIMTVMPPITFIACRYLVASLVLSPILLSKKRQKIDRSDYLYIFFIAFIGYAFSLTMQAAGTRLAGASVGSLINSMNPVFIILFAVPVLKERITPAKIIALCCSVGGAAVIILAASAQANSLAGIICSLVSVVFWSLISVYVRRITKKYGPVLITAFSFTIAFACVLPAAAIELAVLRPLIPITPAMIFGFIYLGAATSAAAMFLWNKSLSLMQAGRCSLFYPIQPLTATLLGVLFLHETVTVNLLIGGVLIIGGILISIWDKKD